MKKSHINLLYDRSKNEHYKLVNSDLNNSDEIIDGELISNGNSVPVVNGIPRFIKIQKTNDQKQTIKSFSYKWKNINKEYSNDINENNDKTFDFMAKTEPERYGFSDLKEMRKYYQKNDNILEVGCGSGHYTSLFLTKEYKGQYIGVDLSEGIDIASKRNQSTNPLHIQASLFDLPFKEKQFDLIHCRGVMHHTPNTKKAFNSLVRHVKVGGEFNFLIYKKNGPNREFTDDFIRENIKDLESSKAWDLLMDLTVFGKELSKIDNKIKLPNGIRILDIPPGEYDVHMLIYNYFLKAFYKSDWNMDENNVITFDWYHPEYVFRHTKEEIEEWCEENNLEILNLDDRWVGFTVRTRKKS